MSPPLGVTHAYAQTSNDETQPVAEFGPQRERMVASSRDSSYLDVDGTNQPPTIKGEIDTEDEEDYEESGVRVFNPRPSLPVPSVEHRSLQNLMDMLDEQAIDLNPEYQRDLVWAKDRMVGLIDSIIENVYIPPRIFNRQITRMEDGTARVKRVCVDGKQRLSSLKAFMDGKIGCHDRHGSVWYFTKPATGRSRRTIGEDFKEAFRNRQLIVYEYRNLKRAQEEDLFSSVQKGVQLTTAEKFRATTGPWQGLAKLYEQKFPRVTGLSGTKRSIGFNNILVSFGMIIEAERGLSKQNPPHFSTSTSTIKALFKNVDDYNADMREKIQQTYMAFDWLIELDPKAFQDNEYTHAKLFSPFEFVATAVLISLHSEKESDQFLIEGIKSMRLHLRQCLKDLRMNRASWDCAWPLIECLFARDEQEMRPSGARSQTQTPVDALVAARTTIAERLSHLKPVAHSAHASQIAEANSEISSEESAGAVSNNTGFVLHRPQDAHGLPNINLHRQEGIALDRSPPDYERVAHPNVANYGNSNSRSLEQPSSSTHAARQQRYSHRSQAFDPSPTEIARKRKLTRFTTSGYNPSHVGRAQPTEMDNVSRAQNPGQRPATGATSVHEAIDETTARVYQRSADECTPGHQDQSARIRVSESYNLISDDESDVSEDLLARFRLHTSKRPRVKKEMLLDD